MASPPGAGEGARAAPPGPVHRRGNACSKAWWAEDTRGVSCQEGEPVTADTLSSLVPILIIPFRQL